MWKTLSKAIAPLSKCEPLLTPELILQQQLRTTFILKRRNAPMLHGKGSLPKRLKYKHFIYDLVEDTSIAKQPDLEVILTTYVEGIGRAGDKVSVRPNYAYNKLLLPGLAIYASPENVAKYESFEQKVEDIEHSSATAQRTVNVLSRVILSVVMNKENPWKLQPWHIKASFRKCGYHVPEETITLPAKAIEGPNMNIQGKEFFVTVTINRLETVNVRCRIHHWSTAITERLQHEAEFWKTPYDPIFAEDTPVLASLPSAQRITNTNK